MEPEMTTHTLPEHATPRKTRDTHKVKFPYKSQSVTKTKHLPIAPKASGAPETFHLTIDEAKLRSGAKKER